MPRAADLPIVRPELVELYLAHRVAQAWAPIARCAGGVPGPCWPPFRPGDVLRAAAGAAVWLQPRNSPVHQLAVGDGGAPASGPDYLVARRPRLGIVLARTDPPALHLQFMQTARSLDFRDQLAHGQFNLLGHLVALAGRSPQVLHKTDWDEGRRLLLEAADRIPNRGKALSAALFNLEATLFMPGCPKRCRAGGHRSGPTSGPRSGRPFPRCSRRPCSTICSRSR